MFELDCDSWLNNSPLPTLWSLHELNVFAVAFLLKKTLPGRFLHPIFHGQTLSAHMHSVHLVTVQCSIFWHAKFWTSPGVEGNHFHVMSSWLLSNCLRILFCNVSQWEQVNLSTGLIHQTVKAAGVNVQIVFQTQLPLYKLDTSIICCSVIVSTWDASRKQIGDMANLAAQRHGRWEGTSELWKARSSEWQLFCVEMAVKETSKHHHISKNMFIQNWKIRENKILPA